MAIGLLDLCRDKLYTQIASSSNLNLRVLVGHSNLLNALISEFNKNPEYYKYAADDNAICGANDDAARSQGTVGIIPAYPRQEDTTTGGYAGWFFPTTDSVFSRYGEDEEDAEEEGDDWGFDSDDDEDPVFSSPPLRVLTLQNPDPDPDLHSVEQSASLDRLASHVLETIYEEDTTPLDPISTLSTISPPSTLGTIPASPSVSMRPAISANSNLDAKRPLLSGMKEVWWKRGKIGASPVCV